MHPLHSKDKLSFVVCEAGDRSKSVCGAHDLLCTCDVCTCVCVLQGHILVTFLALFWTPCLMEKIKLTDCQGTFSGNFSLRPSPGLSMRCEPGLLVHCKDSAGGWGGAAVPPWAGPGVL